MVLDLIEDLRLAQFSASAQQRFCKIIQNLKKGGVEGIILACAELTVLRDYNKELCLIDSSYALANDAVKIALGKKTVPLDTESVYEFWKKRSKMLAAGEVSDYQSTLLTMNSESASQRDSVEKEKLLDIINRHRDRFKGSAIEYGCGVGRITELLANYCDVIDGIDYCDEFINKAKENSAKKGINNIHYYFCPITNFVPKQKYDCAICSGIFEYQDENQFLEMVGIIANSLNTSGVCLIRESVGFHKRFELHGFYSTVLDSSYNAIYRTSQEIVNEFVKLGFSKIYEEISLPPAPGKPETCQKIILLEKKSI
jgi:2-polyprenyl-3-methyl-5-hydroxy-6-metoxy-1,4-benzoquinol methylase